jgi:hypothetical protein
MMDKIEILWEIEQIKQLKARYFRYLDTKQWEKLKAVFAADASIWRLGQEVGAVEPFRQSVDEFFADIMTGHDGAVALSVHQGHMPEITIIDTDHANGIWSMFDWLDIPEKRAFQGFGHYFEEYEKDPDGQWRIKSWRLTRLRVDQVPSTLAAVPNYGRAPSPYFERVPSHWPDSRA